MSKSLKGKIYILLTFLYEVAANVASEKQQFCNTFHCNENSTTALPVCGIRQEGEGYHFRTFENECSLLKYGCEVDEEFAYGLIDISYCNTSINNNLNHNPDISGDQCVQYDCTYPTDSKIACGIQPDFEKYKIRVFKNKCELLKYNCKYKTNFALTDIIICKDLDFGQFDVSNGTINEVFSISNNHNIGFRNEKLQKRENFNESNSKIKNMIIVDGAMLNIEDNINDTIDNFFAATHILDLPLREVNSDILNETTRRRLLKIAGPIKIYKPWITIPKEIKVDNDHLPLLNTCFHKCPKKCPDTYAPVCGNPGFVLAREPSLVFQNHCYMDVAQCKMYWENKSDSARTSAYIESSFTFCLGVEMNGLYRFLPLVRTLQHMGRLKKKGAFKYRLINMKVFNNFLLRQPRIMG